ncbi:MAG: hypothetical protein JWL86_927 [Rhizobium sp.]|nr:hypothetical protein [Rhizobium sp.]
MQKIEKRKQNINDLVSNYRPIGPRHLLAAALMLRARKDADEAVKKPVGKVVAA